MPHKPWVSVPHPFPLQTRRPRYRPDSVSVLTLRLWFFQGQLADSTMPSFQPCSCLSLIYYSTFQTWAHGCCWKKIREDIKVVCIQTTLNISIKTDAEFPREDIGWTFVEGLLCGRLSSSFNPHSCPRHDELKDGEPLGTVPVSPCNGLG
jgi:hypothetical protein